MSRHTLHFKFSSDTDYNNINPYHVMDGKWGGFGPALWHRLSDVHPNNVWEMGTRSSKQERDGDFDVCIIHNFWLRVWDNEKQIWREITEDEHKKLPVLPERKSQQRWNWKDVDFKIPIINMSNVSIPDIISIQPMQ